MAKEDNGSYTVRPKSPKLRSQKSYSNSRKASTWRIPSGHFLLNFEVVTTMEFWIPGTSLSVFNDHVFSNFQLHHGMTKPNILAFKEGEILVDI